MKQAIRTRETSPLQNVHEAETALGLEVFASIPPRRAEAAAHRVPVLTRPSSPTAEAFRSLRMVLELKNTAKRRVILFTSSSSCEAKTFCAVNFAVALAQHGNRTLLVDTDVRRSGVRKSLGLEAEAHPEVHHLSGTTKTGQVITQTDIPDLFVLTTAAPVAHGRAGTSAWSLCDMVGDELLFSFFERIVFDTAPINGASDAPSLVKHASITCLVVEAGETTVESAQHAEALLRKAQARDIGIVLNN
jgi:capsular exopolysaccharide synthesis family protein